MNAQDAFKAGFLSRCVENNLGASEMLERIKEAEAMLDKVANPLDWPGDIVGGAWNLAKSVGEKALTYGVPTAILAPPILGGLAGAGLAKATDISDTDVDDIKDKEVIDEYRRQADRLRRVQAVRALQRGPQRSRRPLM